MSKKLFDSNPYVKEFTTNINKIVEKNNEFHVILNQTAFFPEGGGQPSDIGYIDNIEVTHVYEDNGDIFHVLAALPSKFERVHCTLNWKRRFDFMQQHLGQHILSASLFKLYDAKTIGFHLSSEYTTIDIDRILKEDDIDKAEFFANQIVFNDLVVNILYPNLKELQNLPLRSQPEVSKNIRIVKINDFDYTPCCGTHPNRTGEVGLVKIRKSEVYKGGMRIEFLCGNRALNDYHWKNKAINDVSAMLSIKDINISEGIHRVMEDLERYKREVKVLNEQLLHFEALELITNSLNFHNTKVIKKLFIDRNLKDLKILSSKLTDHEGTVVLFAVQNDDKVHLLFSRSRDLKSIDMNKILKETISPIDGRGGGNEISAQGGAKITENILPALDLALQSIKTQLFEKSINII